MRDLVSTAIVLGALQGIVLAPVLWARRANRLANQLLAVLMAAVALMLAFGEIGARWGFAGHPHLLGLGAPLPFLFSPLLYLYIVALTRPITRFDPRWFAHALPFVADVLFFTLTFYSKSAAEKVDIALLSETPAAPASLHVMTAFEIGQALTYLFLGWHALARYGRKMHGYFSDLARIDLRWLRVLVIANVAVWSIVLVSNVLRVFGVTPAAFGNFIQLGSVAVILLMGYVSLWQPELVAKASDAKVAEPQPEPEPAPIVVPAEPSPAPAPPPGPEVPPPVEAPKYQRNRLDEAEAKELVAKIESLMKERELYKEPGLTLPTLADEVGVTTHMLSQLLNVHIGRSFFVYVNTFRAEALKGALADPKNAERGVLELALEVGFSSKSTLNSSFKKHTGMTPTEFRARALAGQTERAGKKS